jgi:hypothetical protein
MKFSTGKLPVRKKKQYLNAVTEDPAFLQLLKVLEDGSADRAALTLTPGDIQAFGRLKPPIKYPVRVATDTLRKLIKAKSLGYRVFKYQTDEGGWAVVTQKLEAKQKKDTKERAKVAKSA